jgi:hypothetical protein
MTYARPDYCQQNNDPRPFLSGDTIGRFIAGAGIVFSNTDRGELDLSAMQVGGPYLVTFDIANRCASDPIDSIWILSPDNPAFSYPQLEWCEGTRIAPDFIAMVGGTFSEQTGIVNFADRVNGIIENTPSGGPYLINYTTAGACPQTSSAPIIILDKPQNTAFDLNPGNTYCEGWSVHAKASSFGAINWLFLVNGDSIPSDDETAVLTSQILTGNDSLQCVFYAPNGCKDTIGTRLFANPSPMIRLVDSSITVNSVGYVMAKLALQTDMATTQIFYYGSGTNVSEIEPIDGDSISADPSQPIEISITTSIETPFDPAQLSITYVAKAGGCESPSETLVFPLSADDQFFIPEVITPDGNGMNDTWMVTWKDGIDPSLYRIQLFNGAGGKVYEMNGLHQNFDGGNLPDGVYWWTLIGLDGLVLQSGGLTIRRK